VYHVLLQLYNRLPLGAFFRLIEDGGSSLAPASRLLQVYAKEQNPEMLRDFYYSDDRRVESAVLSLDEAKRMKVICETVLSIFFWPTSAPGPSCKNNVDQSRSKILLGG
jgi:Vps16, C-terminal region